MMQDLQTGHMIPLDLDKAQEALRQEGAHHTTQLERMQKACDQALPDRRRHGPILQEGEILIIRGGRFRVDSILSGSEGILLKGLPTKAHYKLNPVQQPQDAKL